LTAGGFDPVGETQNQPFQLSFNPSLPELSNNAQNEIAGRFFETQASPRWIDGLAITLAASLMLTWTWRTWPDLLVDFGRELYIPWQISLGHALYRDIAYLNGPLSPYVNATLMHLFGVSLTTLVVANLAVLAAVLGLLYMLLEAAAERAAAVAGALLFVTLFGFGRMTGIGNYNFLCPYSHEITHGLALSLGAIACLHLPRVLTIRHAVGSGLFMGLVFLTKVEMAVACALALAVGFGLRFLAVAGARRGCLAAAFGAAALTPVLVAFGLLCLRMPAATAAQGTLGSTYWVLASNVSSSPFYRAGLGVINLRTNLVEMGIGVVLLAVAALSAVALGFLIPRMTRGRYTAVAAIVAFVTTVGLGTYTVHSERWFITVPKALPPAMILLLAVWLFAYRRETRGTDQLRLFALRSALVMFGLGLLAKMIFNTRLYHYGFVLAMPATLLLLTAFVSWGPRAAAAHGADGGVVRAIGLGLACVMAIAYLILMSSVLKGQRYRVGSGPDAFLADVRGAETQLALQWISENTPKEATVAVVPQGAMINYLARRSNSTPYIVLMPPELMMYGEDSILHDFQSHPPDYVLLCHSVTTDYGLPLFGHDYGQILLAWMKDNYQEVVLIGDRPLEAPNRFGLLLLRRRAGH
jgi:hypothetical protein